MKNKIIEILENKIKSCDELKGMEREKAVYQSILKSVRIMKPIRPSAEEWLKMKFDEQEYTYCLTDSNKKAFPLEMWVKWMEQYANSINN